MKGADVLRALADGKKVRRVNGAGTKPIDVMDGYCTSYFYNHEFEIVVEEPATDAELVAEMRRMERNLSVRDAKLVAGICADMLEKRSVK